MKDIKNYEGIYAITSCGRVWSYKAKKFLKPRDNGNGYLKVSLSKDGKQKDYYIHRLVAEAYIHNPENKPQVNHIDENKSHNYINNLEWATAKENSNYGTRTQRCAEALGKAVFCIELNKAFKSMREAAEATGAQISHISEVCNGKAKSAGKYHWRFV